MVMLLGFTATTNIRVVMLGLFVLSVETKMSLRATASTISTLVIHVLINWPVVTKRSF